MTLQISTPDDRDWILRVQRQEGGEPEPLGIPGDWSLTFSDEFISPTLDTTKWFECYWWHQHWNLDNGCTNEGNAELQFYLPDQVSIQNQYLRLRAMDTPVVTQSYGVTYPYRSGIVTTGRDSPDGAVRFGFTFGAIEAEIQIASGRGLFPAFWLLPVSNASLPEVDIVEFLGHEPEIAHMTHHWSDAATGERVSSSESISGPDFSLDCHTFGLLWLPGELAWYIDGVQVRRVTANIPSEEMYILLNQAVGGNWPGDPDPDEGTVFPADMEVRYVRVWRAS